MKEKIFSYSFTKRTKLAFGLTTAAVCLFSCAPPKENALKNHFRDPFKENTLQNHFRNLTLVPVTTMGQPEPLEMQYFVDRRQRFLSSLNDNSVVVFPGHSETPRSADQSYEFRQNSNFYYMTGFNEPDSVAVFVKKNKKTKFILFVRPNDPAQEQWRGRRAGLEGAKQKYLADESYGIGEFDSKILEMLKDTDSLYFDYGANKEYDEKANSWLKKNPRLTVVKSGEMMTEMRLIKDDYEQYLIEKSSKISAAAHVRAMKSARKAQHEYELEAEFRYEAAKYGATVQAYAPIVGAGRNATILHYGENDADIHKSDLVLMDAGTEYMNYATDITRTFPVSGQFSEEQKQIYELVLKAQVAAIAQIKPGLPYAQLNVIVRQILTQGLVDLGLLKTNGKTVEQLIAESAYRPFYMHNCCHWVGLDVHDPSSYVQSDGRSRILKPGMVFTVEPGIYINELVKNIDPKWVNIGVRIEDTVLVTENGVKVLSKDVPKSVEEVEKLVSQSE